MTKVPYTSVVMKASGSKMERSTWVSAKRVDDIVRALHRLAHGLLVAHIAVNEGEARVALHRREVLAPTCVGQRVQHAHFVVGVLRQEVLGEVAADEPCAARN
jgi:hypothetical protein